MIRYFAKFNKNIGLFDTMGGGFKPLDLNKQDKELWVLVSNHFSGNHWGDYFIVSEEYANKITHNAFKFQDENNVRFFLPRLSLRKVNDDIQHHPYTICISVSKPALLCQYIDDVKYAYGLSIYGQKAIFEIDSHTADIEDFKRIYSQFEEQVKWNEKEIARYTYLRKKYDIYLKKLEIDKDFR